MPCGLPSIGAIERLMGTLRWVGALGGAKLTRGSDNGNMQSERLMSSKHLTEAQLLLF